MLRGWSSIGQSPVDIPIAMEDQANGESLVEKARAAIQVGKLPARRPDRTFAGPGSGTLCAVCGERTSRDQTEFEIEFNRHGVLPGLDRYHLHQPCFAAWEFERNKGGTST
jgi:hypothetical protein